jgi:hypothetical protein
MDDYCLLNRNLLHEDAGYFYCLDLLLKMPQDYLLVNQHVVETFRFNKPQLEHMTKVLGKRTEILAELFPWDEPNYGIDERWARMHPYGRRAKAGQSLEITVKILNHSRSSQVFTVKPNVPDGFGIKPEKISRNIESRKEAEIHFTVTVPSSVSESLYIITSDIRFGEWDLRHWCESMLEISP